jgi:hypothetical protein
MESTNTELILYSLHLKEGEGTGGEEWKVARATARKGKREEARAGKGGMEGEREGGRKEGK